MCGDMNGKGHERNEEKLLENGNVIYGSVCHGCSRHEVLYNNSFLSDFFYYLFRRKLCFMFIWLVKLGESCFDKLYFENVIMDVLVIKNRLSELILHFYQQISMAKKSYSNYWSPISKFINIHEGHPLRSHFSFVHTLSFSKPTRFHINKNSFYPKSRFIDV